MHAAILYAEATKGTDKRLRCSRRELSILSRIRCVGSAVPVCESAPRHPQCCVWSIIEGLAFCVVPFALR
jgi:hypothetical protein